ncbi:MAG: hypothetical protein ACFFEE_00640 [Candidatus Thorarchaeota archaeon]
MTEASLDELSLIVSELKSNSRLVVMLGSPEGIKSTSRQFSALHGVVKIRRGIFIVQGFSDVHKLILESQRVISFVKTREIPSLRGKSEEGYSNRVYTVVAFSFRNATAQQKKYVERLMRKTTAMRLRPGVALFPILKSKDRRRILIVDDKRLLVESAEFNRLIRENGGSSLRWSRLRTVNLNGDPLIKKAIEQTLSRDLGTLEERIRSLRKRCENPTIAVSQLKKKYTVLSRSFRELKNKWLLSKKLWNYDAEKNLKRTYNMLLSTRRKISSEETRRGG